MKRYAFEQHGDPRSWQSIKRLLRTHTDATLIVPTGRGDAYRLRKASLTEQIHKQICNLF